MNTNINNTMTATTTMTHSRKPKPIICLETNETFPSISMAAKHYNMSGNLIGRMLLGKCAHAKGMHFQFVDQPDVVIHVNNEAKPVEIKRHVTLQKEAIIEANGIRDNGNCKSIMCITDGKSFASMTDAAEHYGISPSQISYACKVKGRTADGKQFCKFSDLYLYIPEISKAINDQTAYDILLERENIRKEMIANVSKCEDEVYIIELKLNEAKKALEQAKMELANFD